MTREEAERECARLASEHPDRKTHSWLPRQEPNGEWSIAKIGLPPADEKRTGEVRADEKPPQADDPRSPVMRDAGAYFGP